MVLKKKLEVTHYERYMAVLEREAGINLVNFVNDLCAHGGIDKNDPSVVDDRVFDTVMRAIFKIPQGKELNSFPKDVISELRAQRSVLFHCWQFARQRKVFRFEKGITAKLLHTHIKKVDSFFVKSPFRSIYLSLPYNEELVIPNKMTGLHKVRGIYLYFDDCVDTDSVIVDVSKGTKLRDLHPEQDTVKSLRFLAVGEGKPGTPLGSRDDSLYYGSVFLAGGDVFPQIEEHFKQWVIQSSGYDEKLYATKLFYFILNALLYITSGSADLANIRALIPADECAKNRGRKASKAVPTVSHIDQVSVGGSIRLSKEFERSYSSGELQGFSINCPRWLVSGHWRNQACGKGLTEHKLLWIEPYEKGKDLDQILIAKETVVS